MLWFRSPKGPPSARVAAAMGYASVPAFGAAFRKMFGRRRRRRLRLASATGKCLLIRNDTLLEATPTSRLAGVHDAFEWRGLCRELLMLAGDFIALNAEWVTESSDVWQKTMSLTAKFANTMTGSSSRCSAGCRICHFRTKRDYAQAGRPDHAVSPALLALFVPSSWPFGASLSRGSF